MSFLASIKGLKNTPQKFINNEKNKQTKQILLTEKSLGIKIRSMAELYYLRENKMQQFFEVTIKYLTMVTISNYSKTFKKKLFFKF
jgi:hypothetical protein